MNANPFSAVTTAQAAANSVRYYVIATPALVCPTVHFQHCANGRFIIAGKLGRCEITHNALPQTSNAIIEDLEADECCPPGRFVEKPYTMHVLRCLQGMVADANEQVRFSYFARAFPHSRRPPDS